VDGGIEVGGRVLDVGPEGRQFLECRFVGAELVPGNGPAVTGERIVEAEAGLDEERAAFLGLALLLVRQEAERCGQDPGEGAEDGDCCLQGLDVVRGNLQQAVAFHHGLPDQAEFTVLEIPDAAVDHVRGSAACTLAVVAPLHQCDIHALQCQVTERAHSIDATSHHQYLGVGTAAQAVDRGAFGSRKGRADSGLNR